MVGGRARIVRLWFLVASYYCRVRHTHAWRSDAQCSSGHAVDNAGHWSFPRGHCVRRGEPPAVAAGTSRATTAELTLFFFFFVFPARPPMPQQSQAFENSADAEASKRPFTRRRRC